MQSKARDVLELINGKVEMKTKIDDVMIMTLWGLVGQHGLLESENGTAWLLGRLQQQQQWMRSFNDAIVAAGVTLISLPMKNPPGKR